MKYFIFLLFLLPIACIAQDFSGIDIFKIGISESELVNKFKDLKLEVKEVKEKDRFKYMNEWSNYSPSTKDALPNLYKLPGDKVALYWPISGLSSQVADFADKLQNKCTYYYLPRWFIGETRLENLYLIFRNNNLEYFDVDYNESLVKAAAAKYKPSKQVDSAYRVNCKYALTGVQAESQAAGITYYEWVNSKNNVKAEQSIVIDSKCKAVLVAYLRFASNSFDLFMKDANKANEAENEAKEKSTIKSLQDKL